jgi:hypothetical protein
LGLRLIAAAAGNFPGRFVGFRSGPFVYVVKGRATAWPKRTLQKKEKS